MTQVTSLGQKDSLEEEMATCSSILPGENSMHRAAWQSMVSQKSWKQLNTHTLDF